MVLSNLKSHTFCRYTICTRICNETFIEAVVKLDQPMTRSDLEALREFKCSPSTAVFYRNTESNQVPTEGMGLTVIYMAN